MANCAIVGINWGDEGKGRMVDYLTNHFDVVVRYQGGGNAGHTVVNDRGTFALHLLPSGIFREGVVNILGNGVALDCENLLAEMNTLRAAGVSITPENLKISDRASLLLPWHRELDALENVADSIHAVSDAMTELLGTNAMAVDQKMDESRLQFKLAAAEAREHRHADDAQQRVDDHGERAVFPAQQRAAQMHGEQREVDRNHRQGNLNLGANRGQRGHQGAEHEAARRRAAGRSGVFGHGTNLPSVNSKSK